MADVKILHWDSTHTSDLTGLSSPLTANYTSQNIINDGRMIWHLKVVVASVTGTNPTLTPQLAGANADAASFLTRHAPHNAMSAGGTFWFSFPHLDVTDSPYNDRLLQLKLNVGGTSPSFTLTSVDLIGIKP